MAIPRPPRTAPPGAWMTRSPTPGPYRPPPPARTGAVDPLAGWQHPSAAQTLAQAQALAAAQQSPYYQSIADQQAFAQQTYDAHIAQQQTILQALSGFLGGIGGPIRKDYNQIATSQLAFGKGYSTGMQMLMQGQANKTNAYLSNVVGAPDAQLISGDQASQGADVLMGVGGTIPAEQFKAQGAAYGAAAAQFVPIAQAQEKISEVGIQAEYQQLSNQFAQQLQDLSRQNPAIVAQFLDELYTQQRADRQDFLASNEQPKVQGSLTTGLWVQNADGSITIVRQPQANATAASNHSYQVARNLATHMTSQEAQQAKAQGYTSWPVWEPVQLKDGSWTVKNIGPGQPTGAKPKAPLKPGTTIGPYYIGRDGKQHLSPEYKIDPTTGKPVKVYKPAGPGKKTISMDLSKGAGKWIYTDGTLVPPAASVNLGPPPRKTPAKGSVPTPNELNTMVSDWYNGKPSQVRTVVPAPTKSNKNATKVQITEGPATGQLGYQQAYQRLRALHVSDQQARQLLNTQYHKGERGRPYLSAPERAAMAKAQAPTHAFYNKHTVVNPQTGKKETHTSAYLTADQAMALQAAGMALPPGEWADSGSFKDARGRPIGRIYYIFPGF